MVAITNNAQRMQQTQRSSNISGNSSSNSSSNSDSSNVDGWSGDSRPQIRARADVENPASNQPANSGVLRPSNTVDAHSMPSHASSQCPDLRPPLSPSSTTAFPPHTATQASEPASSTASQLTPRSASVSLTSHNPKIKARFSPFADDTLLPIPGKLVMAASTMATSPYISVSPTTSGTTTAAADGPFITNAQSECMLMSLRGKTQKHPIIIQPVMEPVYSYLHEPHHAACTSPITTRSIPWELLPATMVPNDEGDLQQHPQSQRRGRRQHHLDCHHNATADIHNPTTPNRQSSKRYTNDEVPCTTASNGETSSVTAPTQAATTNECHVPKQNSNSGDAPVLKSCLKTATPTAAATSHVSHLALSRSQTRTSAAAALSPPSIKSIAFTRTKPPTGRRVTGLWNAESSFTRLAEHTVSHTLSFLPLLDQLRFGRTCLRHSAIVHEVKDHWRHVDATTLVQRLHAHFTVSSGHACAEATTTSTTLGDGCGSTSADTDAHIAINNAAAVDTIAHASTAKPFLRRSKSQATAGISAAAARPIAERVGKQLEKLLQPHLSHINALVVRHIGDRLSAHSWLPNATNLRHLTLTHFRDLTDTHLHVMCISSTPHNQRMRSKTLPLRELTLSHCPALTSMASISRHCPRLVKLNLQGCRKIQRIDSLKPLLATAQANGVALRDGGVARPSNSGNKLSGLFASAPSDTNATSKPLLSSLFSAPKPQPPAQNKSGISSLFAPPKAQTPNASLAALFAQPSSSNPATQPTNTNMFSGLFAAPQTATPTTSLPSLFDAPSQATQQRTEQAVGDATTASVKATTSGGKEDPKATPVAEDDDAPLATTPPRNTTANPLESLFAPPGMSPCRNLAARNTPTTNTFGTNATPPGLTELNILDTGITVSQFCKDLQPPHILLERLHIQGHSNKSNTERLLQLIPNLLVLNIQQQPPVQECQSLATNGRLLANSQSS